MKRLITVFITIFVGLTICGVYALLVLIDGE